MGLFDNLRAGLQKTHSRLAHEIKRIVTGSPKLTGATLEELEGALLGADLGVATTHQTTAAKLAHLIQARGQSALLAACDTFRAAAIEQLKLWGERLHVPVIAGDYGADPASVAHDAVTAALARKADYLLVDTAGRLHTKHNLMQELQKLHRVMDKKLPGAPHETLLVLDGSTGMNALNQAREFHKAVNLTGLVVTKLDGTSKGGMVVAIQQELGLPIKFVGLGEQPDDLQPFDAKQFAEDNADLRAYRSAKSRTTAEMARGEVATLEEYRASRSRRKK